MRSRRLRRLIRAALLGPAFAGAASGVAGCVAAPAPAASAGPNDGASAGPNDGPNARPSVATTPAIGAAAACAGCHPDHAADWSLGMHAFAADDPVFVAMNARGQRETGGALGDFCVRCHAPLALARGATSDGENLASLDASLRGVTCVVCHTASVDPSVDGGSLAIADDGVMRGPIADPVPSAAHASMYSPAHDRTQPAAAELCGACHAVTNAHGLEIERTIDEWRQTAYAQPATLKTCGKCHMAESPGHASTAPGSPARAVHGHTMPGLDWGAGSPDQQRIVQATLDPAIASSLCVTPGDAGARITVTVENALVGHAWPSGATQDRRAWVEIIAYAGGAIVYRSGTVPDDVAVNAASGDAAPLLLLEQRLFDATGGPTLFAWSASSAQADLLSPATADAASATRSASVVVPVQGVDRVTSSVHVRALDHDVAGALLASGDLAPAVAEALPTLTVRATELEWTADRGAACLP